MVQVVTEDTSSGLSAEEPARDVEPQVVPEEVSGYLTRDGSEASGQIISESQAADWERLVEQLQDRPLYQPKSPNHYDPGQILIGFMLSVIAGAQRFAHANQLRAD